MAAQQNVVINEAYAKLKVLSDVEANRMLYESRLKAQRDEKSRIDGALAEGRMEGEVLGISKVIYSMTKQGLDINQISAYTDTPITTVEEILKAYTTRNE